MAGNIADMYYCYDIASWIQGLTLPNSLSLIDWKGEIVLVRMLDYMLGVNPLVETDSRI